MIPKDRPAHSDYRKVTCNGCGTDTSVHPSATPEEARATLANFGWSHRSTTRQVKDFCPRCTSYELARAGI